MVLRFTERVGTSGNDSLTASFNTITFGLAGNDVISATSNQDFMLAVPEAARMIANAFGEIMRDKKAKAEKNDI